MSSLVQEKCDAELDALGGLYRLISPALSLWRLTAGLIILTATGASLISLLRPVVYEVTTVIHVEENPQPVGLLRRATDQGSEPAAYYIAILQSSDLKREVVSRLRLSSERDFAGQVLCNEEDAALQLEQWTTIKQDRTGGISVTVLAQQPGCASRIADTFIDVLDDALLKTHARQKEALTVKEQETLRALLSVEHRLRTLSGHNLGGWERSTARRAGRLDELDRQLLALGMQTQQLRSEAARNSLIDLYSDLGVREQAIRLARTYTEHQESDDLTALIQDPNAAAHYASLELERSKLSETLDCLALASSAAMSELVGRDMSFVVVDRGVPRNVPRSLSICLHTVIGAIFGLLLSIVIGVYHLRCGLSAARQSVDAEYCAQRLLRR